MTGSAVKGSIEPERSGTFHINYFLERRAARGSAAVGPPVTWRMTGSAATALDVALELLLGKKIWARFRR